MSKQKSNEEALLNCTVFTPVGGGGGRELMICRYLFLREKTNVFFFSKFLIFNSFSW